ncbi:hypothetical protein GCM10023156_00900 [Novipirellula rosea]|uniref:Uncharacterized protein n=1 Tax=Novipirellula rosea TaxID=1031540 RepID=A0ABP8M2Z9_9BACT
MVLVTFIDALEVGGIAEKRLAAIHARVRFTQGGATLSIAALNEIGKAVWIY